MVMMTAKPKILAPATMIGCPVIALSMEWVRRACCFHTMLLYLHTQSEWASLTATTWPAASNRDTRNGGSLITSFDVFEIIDITPCIAQVLPSFLSTFSAAFFVEVSFRCWAVSAVPASIWKTVSECWDSCEIVLRQLSKGGACMCGKSNADHLASALITLAFIVSSCYLSSIK